MLLVAHHINNYINTHDRKAITKTVYRLQEADLYCDKTLTSYDLIGQMIQNMTHVFYHT